MQLRVASYASSHKTFLTGMNITYRTIEQKDNAALATLIRNILEEFHIDKPGTAYTDPTTDDLFSLFRISKSAYFVALDTHTIIGGCGIYPTDGLPKDCTELVKYYVRSDYRGRGIGTQLMQLCVDEARIEGYRRLYLETATELLGAIGLYERAGFRRLTERLGNSGHYFCTVQMLKDL
jgi:putative acetyltransferase